MDISINFFSLILLIIALTITSIIIIKNYAYSNSPDFKISIETINDIKKLFPRDAHEIDQRVDYAIEQARIHINKILAIEDNLRTYDNTVAEFDKLTSLSHLAIANSIISAMSQVSPDATIVKNCQKNILKISQFVLETIENNKQLYHAIASYADNNGTKEALTKHERYFLNKSLEDFALRGLALSDEKLQEVRDLQQQLTELELTYKANLDNDKSSITVSKNGLEGVGDDFIKQLKQTTQKEFIVGVDYPTYMYCMRHCTNENTRRALYKAFTNRAYPTNENILHQIIQKRHALAQALGFDTYSDFNLKTTMAHSCLTVDNFITQLIEPVTQKAKKEFQALTKQLPPSVRLTQEGTIKPWDMLFLKTYFQEHFFNLDDRLVTEYFPTEKTIDSLVDIYAKFFNLSFNRLPIKNLWHKDVMLLQVSDNNKQTIIGYILMDLYPRTHKFSHECQTTLIPAVQGAGPSVGLIIANFPKATRSKPALLTFRDVEVFFHEFGHTMHALLGRTTIGSLSGTQVKLDFVEMPSQMFEQWLYEKEILTMISSHYKTGKPLSADLIENILKTKNINSGLSLLTQMGYALLSLEYFKEIPENLHTAMNHTFKKIPTPIFFDPDNHMYTSFCHLTDYGARYYSYLWSKVYALDLFYQIKSQGLGDPEVGNQLREHILSKGGCEEPMELITNFLGRKPSRQAFFKDLEL